MTQYILKAATRLCLLPLAAALPLAVTACAPAPKNPTQIDSAQIDGAQIDSAHLHERLLTLDSHVDIPLSYMREVDPGGATELQVDLAKLKAGALDAAFFIVYTPQGNESVKGYAKAKEVARTRILAIESMLRTYPDQIELALTADDVRRINKSGKLAALIGMENAFPLADDLSALKHWAVDHGVRYVGLTHFGHNQFGDSSNPHEQRDNAKPRFQGLSEAGRKLVAALNDYGVMVDVSHASKATMMQAADLSRTPIIASHSGAQAVGDNPRNLDDEQLRKIAEVGGVAQMVAFDGYVKPLTQAQKDFQTALRAEMGLEGAKNWNAASDSRKAEYRERRKAIWQIVARANVADFVNHIDHAVTVAGIDHVGIASDFDGGGGLSGWEDASETANVTAELSARGYSEGDIQKLWADNLLRVMDAAKDGARAQ